MSAENGTLHLTLAMTQLPILLLFWRASHKQEIPPTKRSLARFVIFITLFNILAQLALWTTRQTPANPTVSAVLDGAFVLLTFMIFATLIGALAMVLRGAFRPTRSS